MIKAVAFCSCLFLVFKIHLCMYLKIGHTKEENDMTKMNILKNALDGAVQDFTGEIRKIQIRMLEKVSVKTAVAKLIIPMAAAEVIVLSLIMQLITKCSLGMSAINAVSEFMSEIAFIKLSADNYDILSQLALLGIFCLGVFKANIGISDFVPKPAAARRNEVLLATISNRFFLVSCRHQNSC